ncbi:Saccharopine dehydrogenase, NADP-dependent [Ruminococcaceae bacterium YAD3003]|nr:Saccharopine dehydrogenase, NADP-dependent [Ruminococcaceae bacterium YAD3003]
MKRVLILGCNEITRRLLIELIRDPAHVSDIYLASRNKEDCNELKNLAASMGVRVTTSGIDVSNVEGAMMMIKILSPDLVVNLLPPELALDAMNLAVKARCDYIDPVLFGVPKVPSNMSLLSKQFEKFGEFQNNCRTAVCGVGLVPGAVNTIIRQAKMEQFKKIDTIDIVAVAGERKTQKVRKSDVDYTLYAEDVKPPMLAVKNEPGEMVFYIDEGKVVEADSSTVEAQSFDGSTVFLASSPILTDIIKEFPDAVNVRYFKLGRKSPKVHVAPKEKLALLEELGLMSDKPVKVGNVEVAPIDLVASILPKMSEKATSKESDDDRAEGLSTYEIYISGTSKTDDKEITKSYIIKGDNDKTYEKYNQSAFDFMKGSALIAGVKLMCKDKWRKPGVFTPAAFDCESYYSAFKKEGITITEGEGKPF